MLRFLVLLIVLLVSLFPVNSYAQEKDNDLRVWEDVKAPDTLRLKAIDDILVKVIRRDPDSCLTLSKMMIDFAELNGYQRYQVIGLRWRARVYDATGFPLKSLETLEKAEKIALETDDLKLQGTVYNSFGIVHKSLSNYSLSIEYYLKGLAIDEKLNSPMKMQQSYRNIGMVFGNIQDYEKANEYYQKGLAIIKKHGLNRSLPFYYNSLGSLERERGNVEDAIFYYGKIISMGDSVQNQMLVAAAYHNLGLTYWKGLDQLDSALINFERSLDHKKKIGWTSAFGSTYTGLGGVNSHIGRYDKALSWCILSMEEAKKRKSLVVEKNACGCLYEAYKGLGKLDSALHYHEKLEVMTDSLTNVDREKEINRKELGYTFEKKAMADSLKHESEQAILVEQTEKQRLGLFAAGGGLLLIIALAFSIYSGKKKSDELLLNILPAETAAELKQKGHSDARLIDEVTVLFTDFKGFTAMSEQLSPKDLVEDLNICFSEFDKIMEKHGIEKIKTIGDAYMAASGLPSPNDEHAQNVIKAAFEMRDFVEAGKARKIENGLPYFEIRIGVHTGPVVAGIVGIKKFQYDIWGDAVNTASRMESSGEVGKVNISETTFGLIKGDFDCEHRGKVAAKGKGELDMYFVEPKNA